MAYAVFADVTARAGRVAGAFSVAGKHPDQADVEKFLADVSALIDAAIRSRGFDPAGLDQTVKDALKDLAAYGALARSLTALDPTGRSGFGALLTEAQGIWEAGLAGIEAGTAEAILELEAGVGGGGTGSTAGSLSIDDPAYGQNIPPAQRLELNADFAPAIARTQKL